MKKLTREVVLTKKDVAARLAEYAGVKTKEATEMWDVVTKFVKDTLLDGAAIRISGVGTLWVKDRDAHQSVSPLSGKVVNTPERYTFKLKGKTEDR